jgi:DNA-directed RNA polymerase beta subunit
MDTNQLPVVNPEADFTLDDVYLGADDITDYLLDGQDNPGADAIMAATPSTPEPLITMPTYDQEPEGTIDPTLTSGDMMTVLYAEIKKKKLAGHHIDSMNSFTRVGIKQIVTKVFKIEKRIKNLRDKTEEDRDIAEIFFDVAFTDVNLHPPTIQVKNTGATQLLTPNMARFRSLNYSCAMYIDAKITATAVYKSGATKTRTAEFSNHRIASIPCAVGSELCHTSNCSKATLRNIEEDPQGTGGFFIIKGTEWAIDNLENISNNTFHVYKNMHLNEIARGTFLSKPGDAYENSYQIILRYLNSGAITLEITTSKFDKIEIPFYLIFRALGMTRDREIVDHIVYGVENTDIVTVKMLEILQRAFEVEDAKFGSVRTSTVPTAIIQAISQKIIEGAQNVMARRDDNVNKYLNSNILGIFDRFTFPHIGTGVEHRITKLRFLGHLINKMLGVYMGIIEPTDRDSYKNKRVFAAGSSIAKTFKTAFNFAIVQETRKRLQKDFKTTPFSQVALAESVKAAINSDNLERMLVQAIITGSGTVTIRRNEVTNRLSSQTLQHKNDMNVKGTLNTINTSNTSSSKQNERADEMRRVHPHFVGYIDPTQSADTGESVGRTKQMAVSASVCDSSSSIVLKQILASDPEMIKLDDTTPAQISRDKLSKIFVNGSWIGCCKQSHELVRRYRMYRRHGDIHHLTTIVWEILIREVYFWTDTGRLMRPLIIVYNNAPAYIENWRTGDRSMKFNQWIKLTKDHIQGLRNGTITMDDLRVQRVIEYISPEEQDNTYLAHNIKYLRENADNVRMMFTHCDIDQAIMGLVTMASPMADHSNSSRNTMYTNHRKQSSAWFSLAYPFRIDKNMTLQHYCERPLVTTFSDLFTYPNGQNIIVALIMHGGDNMEDSIIINQSSVDCGMFNASFYSYEKADLSSGEQFGMPDPERTMDIRKDASYEHIKNGFVQEGALVHQGDVLIVKTAKIPKPTTDKQYVDKSIVYNKPESVRIERVIVAQNDADAVIAKVKYRADRPLLTGDKLCLTPGHEVLTERGWIPIADVQTSDLVVCNKQGSFSYEHPTDVYSYDHDDVVCSIKAAGIDQCVTMDHRMYVCTSQSAHKAVKNDPTCYIKHTKFELIQAKHLLGVPSVYCKTTSHENPDIHDIQLDWLAGDDREAVADAWVKLIAYTTFRTSSDGVYYGKRMDQVEALCDQLNIIHAKEGRGLHIYCRDLPKHEYPSWLLNMSRRRTKIFMDGISTLHTTANDRFISILALRAGYSTVRKDDLVSISRAGNYPVATAQCQHYTGKVYCISVPSEVFYVRRKGVTSWTGNSSRTGNKGINAKMYARYDMPYAEDGLVADALVNGHSIPTRMAINQVLECMLSILAAKRGSFIDMTPFHELDVDACMKMLEELGVHNGGHRRMYNGKLGLWLDTLIFVGPTTYQRLQKYIIDEHYAMTSGPTYPLTRQPVDRKANRGGLRVGEMEKDTLCAHGVMRMFGNKFYTDSDGMELHICRVCGNKSIVNEKTGMYYCRECKDAADIAVIHSSAVANVMTGEAAGMNISTKFELEPYTFAKLED